MAIDKEVEQNERIIAAGKAAYEAGKTADDNPFEGWCMDYTYWYQGWAGNRPGMYVGH